MRRRIALLATLAVPAAGAPAAAQLPEFEPPAPPQLPAPERAVEPVVLKGSDLAGWAVPAETTLKLPLTDLTCYELDPAKLDPAKLLDGGASGLTGALDPSNCPHNDYAEPEVSTAPAQPAGPPVGRIAGLRYDPATQRFTQIPLQVDEVFTRYLDNSASGFAPYSGQDRHTTYAYDREGFRYHLDGPADDPCRAQAAGGPAPDPIAGLDADDEIAFMARDAGPPAPAGTPRPKGTTELRRIDLPGVGTVYVALGLKPRFDATNGYVRYQRDADADLYELSESTYDNYGNARVGTYCDAEGNPAGTGRRRPRDGATITTSRYKFRYDGRWLMTGLQIRGNSSSAYGRDLVDRWKARAFAQDPGSETPCCGYEEEDTNWGGSSTLLGERVGPVRAIRETWGADSGTNVIRRETFYREQMVQRTWLRVHVIPPLDGIYAQWDFNAGAVDRFRTSRRPDGVPIDGRNDEPFGNLDDPCEPKYDGSDTGQFDQTFRQLYRALQACELPFHQSVDLPDLSLSEANASLGWTQTSGPHGTIVDRISTSVDQLSPGGAVQSVLAVPYYRDDACFDDGTGSDPGPVLHPRHPDREAQTTAPDGSPRRCWRGQPAIPNGDQRFWQGSIGTHGLHLLLVAESDNARQTVPLTEIVSDWRMVMLPGDPGNVGERYGRAFEQPLLPVVTPAG